MKPVKKQRSVRMRIIKLLSLTVLLLLLFPYPTDDTAERPTFKPPDKVIEHNQIEPSRSGSILYFEATAYCLEDGNGDGVTATGTIPQEGRTVAADPKLIPYGTELIINGKDGYIVEDCGGAIKGHRIDIFMNSRNNALQFGRQTVRVQIKDGE
jgi:3D (Asp-Asp-Asp) domain-containing protein